MSPPRSLTALTSSVRWSQSTRKFLSIPLLFHYFWMSLFHHLLTIFLIHFSKPLKKCFHCNIFFFFCAYISVLIQRIVSLHSLIWWTTPPFPTSDQLFNYFQNVESLKAPKLSPFHAQYFLSCPWLQVVQLGVRPETKNTNQMSKLVLAHSQCLLRFQSTNLCYSIHILTPCVFG